MKSAEEWIDDELALLMSCKPQELKVIPKEYAKMVAFIEQIQQDAFAAGVKSTKTSDQFVNPEIPWLGHVLMLSNW